MRLEVFNRRGFEIIDGAFDTNTIDFLIFELSRQDFGETVKQRKSVVFGVRNLANVASFIKEFANSESVGKFITPIVGDKARLVRAIFFDKTPEANWKVPFHQDLTISVKKKKETKGFSAWTFKANILHVQPPVSVLENIVALRIHLDKTDDSNGALRIIPGSHRFGRLSPEKIQELRLKNKIEICSVEKGGAMLMRPLLLHASSSAVNASHRRVLHFEFSSEKLPGNLEWFGS